jgi:hypothetical protein
MLAELNPDSGRAGEQSHCFYKTIDAVIGCLYPPPRHTFPPALREVSAQRNLQAIEIPLDFLHGWPTRRFENPIKRDEEDKCAV